MEYLNSISIGFNLVLIVQTDTVITEFRYDESTAKPPHSQYSTYTFDIRIR